MKKTFSIPGFLIIAATLALAATAAAQDFQKSSVIRGGGQISVSNISGTIKVTGYSGSSIEVKAYKTGRDKDLVKVEDTSAGDRIELKASYPRDCNCDASINFELLVPAQVSYDFKSLNSVSGNIEITGVRGSVKTATVSGGVAARGVTGNVSASSVSGNVDAEISAYEGSDDMKFTSVSGSVRVVAPAALSATVEMSSLSGTLDTNFPIAVQTEKYGPGRKVNAQLGNGQNKLKISTVSGNVALIKG
jgi:hypothetical protein